MKSAEEWLPRILRTNDEEQAKYFAIVIKQIQLDAWKQGMTDARNTIATQLTANDATNDQDYAAISERRNCMREILTARDERKEI